MKTTKTALLVAPCPFVRGRRRRSAWRVDALAAVVSVVVAQRRPYGGEPAVVGRSD